MIKRLCTHSRLALSLFLTAFLSSPLAIAATSHQPAAQFLGGAGSKIDGHWEGVMDRDGAKMTIGFDFKTQDGETSIRFSSDSWMVMDWPVGALQYEPPKLHFNLGGDSGDRTAFDGTLDGNTIAGRFAGSEGQGSFSLRRVAPVSLPYNREEVSFHNGGVTLFGTLLIPRGHGPHPAIVLVHGSLAETRWGTIMFFADRLVRRGIAALVYDKRGTGSSTGAWKTATYEDLSDDALAGIHLLQQRKDIHTDRIGAFGHSEGGAVVTIMAARSKDVAFIISADGTAGPSYKQDLFRVQKIVESNGFSKEEVAKAMAFYTMWLQVARTGHRREQLDAEIPKVENEKWFDLVAPPPKDHWAWTEYRKRADFDSLIYWAKVKVPVLLLYGELDEMVPVTESIEQIDETLRAGGNPDYTEILIPRAQHNLTVHPAPGPPYTCPMHPQVVQSEPGTCPICKMALQPHPSSEWWHLAPGLTDLLAAWVHQRTDATRDGSSLSSH
jgi:pimeloyl-ACP methyl ester carboxylesterase